MICRPLTRAIVFEFAWNTERAIAVAAVAILATTVALGLIGILFVEVCGSASRSARSIERELPGSAAAVAEVPMKFARKAPWDARARLQAPIEKDTDGKEPAPQAAEPVRVRDWFPETLLWRPELITDDQGRATLDLDLADSITTWRLAASAVTAAGQLGADQASIRVFQPFFVDLNLPVTLTRGDEVSVPVVVYNYLDRPQTVELTLADGTWFKRLGKPAEEDRAGGRRGAQGRLPPAGAKGRPFRAGSLGQRQRRGRCRAAADRSDARRPAGRAGLQRDPAATGRHRLRRARRPSRGASRRS